MLLVNLIILYIYLWMDQNYAEQVKQQYREGNQYSESFDQEKNQTANYSTDKDQNQENQQSMKFDHKQMGQYANMTLEVEDQEQTGVKLRVVGTDVKGSAFTKYTVYIIKGEDKNGSIDVCRRFNQFHELRVAMVKRWPGCFIPSIPSKNFVKKNDKEMVEKRQRYLNDFVIKMTKLPHLYMSEEFQTFLRSKESDVSSTYANWPNPSYASIINKYRDSFHNLQGKNINQSTNEQIAQFYACIKKNQSLLEKYRGQAKQLAIARDNYNQNLPKLTSLVLPTYEKTCLAEYTNGKEQCLIYLNGSEAKLSQHQRILQDMCKKNPYWLLYDLIKNQERDGRAFIQALTCRQTLEGKRGEIESKMKNHEKQIMEGKKTSKSSSEEVKYKLESELEEMKKQKDTILMLTDIISALIVYVEMEKYRQSKIKFYHNTLKKLGGFEINNTQIGAQVWSGVKESTMKVSSEYQIKESL